MKNRLHYCSVLRHFPFDLLMPLLFKQSAEQKTVGVRANTSSGFKTPAW